MNDLLVDFFRKPGIIFSGVKMRLVIWVFEEEEENLCI